MTMLVQDLSEARRLLSAGLHLVKLKPFLKEPEGEAWNDPRNRAREIDPAATGYGLPLALNKACSVDPDNAPLAYRGMAALGLNLEAIMAAGVRTKSTRPGSGGRSVFAEEPDLSWIKFASRDPAVGTVLELRAASPNLQDVVPGLVYRDKRSGALYTQSYVNHRRWDDLPGLPDELLEWWQRCSTDIDFLREQQAKFFAAIEAAPNLAISTGRGGHKLAFEAPGYRGRYNASNTVESILDRHNYTWHAKLKRWAPPTASGAPGVREIPGKDGLWQSDHASDPLTGTFDAWVAHVVLDHHGDVEAAKRAMGTPNDDPFPPVSNVVPETDKTMPPISAEASPVVVPVDPFIEHPVPPFPLEVLPELFSDYAKACSKGSGFDAGAYGFSLLILASGMVDQRSKLHAGPMRVPPHLWGSLSAASGGGKSPVLNAASFAIHEINKDALKQSTSLYAKWAQLPNEERLATPAPPIRQMLLDNTTIEAAGNALRDNPEGVILVLPELSEWVGRMDAYSGGQGRDKDRGAWIRAFDGGPVSINRAKASVPMLLDNFSAAILAGIQPEKLAAMYSKAPAGGSDGLFQRFLPYCIAPPGEVDYQATLPVLMEYNVQGVFARLAAWRESGAVKACRLSPDAMHEAEANHNLLRVLSRRTPPGRFAEHIDKLPGLTLRVAFALHMLHAAAADESVIESPPQVVTVETYRLAQAVMRVLYRHAEAAYAQLDHTGVSATIKLAKAACEAILSQGWQVLQRGDLTRYATGWSGADDRHTEGAIDLLIDWLWIADVTPATPAGKRGRRSMGRYQVNLEALQRFEPHARRITRERAERHQAIQRLALARYEAD